MKLTPNPKQGSTTDTFYHKAANYSVLALLAPIVLNMFLREAFSGMPTASRVFPLITGLIMLSAIPAAIIALAGIRKHGTKGLLIKGLFGLIIPFALVVMAVPAFKKVREASLQVSVSRTLEDFASKAPFMVDEETRLESVSREADGSVVATFTLVNSEKGWIDMNLWNNTVIPKIIQSSQHTTLGQLRKQHIRVSYQYLDRNGVEISKFDISE